MRVVHNVAELRIAVKAMREQGLRIGFVPTMDSCTKAMPP